MTFDIRHIYTRSMTLLTQAKPVMLAMLLAAVSAGCSDGKYSGGEEPQLPEDGRYIVLKITVPRADYAPRHTRANPMGGEDGNGREPGIENNEDIIHDLNIFFYKETGTNKGVNSDGSAKILVHKYFNTLNKSPENNSHENSVSDNINDVANVTVYEDKIEYTVQLKTDEELEAAAGENSKLNFITVCNAGRRLEITPADATKGLTLGDVRDYHGFSSTWSTASGSVDNPTVSDNFVMTTAYYYSKNHPAEVTITSDPEKGYGLTLVERLAARIDLWYKYDENDKENSSNNLITNDGNKLELKYDVTTTVGNKEVSYATVYITNVLPVNVMKQPSYLIKRVTNGSMTNLNNLIYGGQETPYPVTGTDNDRDKPTNLVVEPQTSVKAGNGTKDLVAWYGDSRKGNISANSFVENNSIDKYYHAAPASNTDPNYDCNHISVIGYANENTQVVPETGGKFNFDYVTGLAFKAQFVPKHWYTYSKVDGETEASIRELKENGAYPRGETFYRYSETTQTMDAAKPTVDPSVDGSDRQDIFFKDENEAIAYKQKRGKNGIITKYENGVCYYNLWLRHYNDDADGKTNTSAVALPMEYAIVRNNIYRVAIRFEVIGDPTPEIREDTHIHSRIFVRKWNMRKENSPIVF